MESRSHLTATVATTFIGAAESTGAAHLLIPYSTTSTFELTGGKVLTRLLSSGRADTRFAGGGSIKLDTKNAIEAVAAAPDGGAYVEYGLAAKGSTTLSDIGIQHFTKTGRLDSGFGTSRLLRMSNYNRSATFAPGPMSVSSDGRLYFESAGTLYLIPDNGSVAGIRHTDAHSTGTRIVFRSDGAVFILGNGVTAYDSRFQRITTFGTDGVAMTGQTVIDGGFDDSGRLVVTVAGSSSTAAPTLERFTSHGVSDKTFGTSGSIELPSAFLSTGSDFAGSHLVVRSDGSAFVSGGISVTTGSGSTAKTTQQAAVLGYDYRGRLIDKLFSNSSDGVLSNSAGTLEGSEVDIAGGPNGSVYVATLIDRTSDKTTYDFIEQLALKPFSGV